MRFIFSLTFLLLSLHSLSAQNMRSRADLPKPKQQESRFIQSYLDSLYIYKDRLDSISEDSFYQSNIYKSLIDRVGYDNLNSSKINVLFMPLRFYHAPAQHLLKQGDTTMATNINNDIDRALMHIYLTRPDLVLGSETDLEEAGPIISAQPSTVEILPEVVSDDVPPPAEPELTPTTIVVRKPNFWTFNGDYYLQFLQNYISSNWYQGGTSNYSMMGNVVLQANYNNKQKVKFSNKLEIQLGLATNSSDTIHKFTASQNIIRYTGNLGLQASKKWYYTLQTIATTQLVKGVNANDRTIYSDIMSPFNFNISLGMDYNIDLFNNRLTGSIHIAPIGLNYKYVGRIGLAPANGIPENKHSNVDYGSELSMNITWKFSDMIKWTSRLYNFTTYKRYEMQWENTFIFQFNRYISTNVYLYPRFDDNVARMPGKSYWQFKEYASVGFSYSM